MCAEAMRSREVLMCIKGGESGEKIARKWLSKRDRGAK
jgi:hypothetical protein